MLFWEMLWRHNVCCLLKNKCTTMRMGYCAWHTTEESFVCPPLLYFTMDDEKKEKKKKDYSKKSQVKANESRDFLWDAKIQKTKVEDNVSFVATKLKSLVLDHVLGQQWKRTFITAYCHLTRVPLYYNRLMRARKMRRRLEVIWL